MEVADLLTQGLDSLALNISPPTQAQLLEYLNLLKQWNQVYNLTGVREITAMVPKHILDSLAILPYVCGNSILDVGTGAGLPGLLFAITRPNWQCFLLDSNAKKIRFIRQAVIELKLKNVIIIHSRLEKFKSDQTFDTIIARAYTNLPTFYQQTIRFSHKNSCLLAMKGLYPTEELAAMKNYAIEINCFPLKIPQLIAQRHLVRINLNSDTPITI